MRPCASQQPLPLANASSVCVSLHILDGCVRIQLKIEQHSPEYIGGRSGSGPGLPVTGMQYTHLLSTLYHALEVVFLVLLQPWQVLIW